MDDKVDWNERQRGMIRNIAHDVRTPLTSISGFAELLAEDESLSPGARENVEIIRAEIRRLAEMLEVFFGEITPRAEQPAATSPDNA